MMKSCMALFRPSTHKSIRVRKAQLSLLVIPRGILFAQNSSLSAQDAISAPCLIQQITVEQIEQKVCLSAPAYTRNGLDQPILIPPDQPIQIDVKLINFGTSLFYVICQRSKMADRVNSWSVIIYLHFPSLSSFSFDNSAKRSLTPPGYTQRINLFCRLCTNQGLFFRLNRRWKSRKSATSPMSSITGRSPGYAESGGSPWGLPRAPGRRCGG